ncbi:Integrator complex subunit 3 [Coemansia sp. RSA 2702]|nr:Integrator complex subunit 3 [Coemansia sp. RSA 2702]
MAEIQTGGTHSPLPPQPQLFQLEPIDVAEPWQHELIECFISFSTLAAGKSQTELHETLQQKASESMHSHGELVNGLVYGILTVPAEGNTYLRHLNIVSRDGFAHAISRLKLLATAHRFARVRPEVRSQLFWLLSELVKVSAHGVDQVVLALTRQVRSGDVTQGNVKLCWLMVRFAQANYAWLSTFPVLVATMVYMLGRLALDHSRVPDLRAAECELAVQLLREQFHECCMIGRDLVRMLQDVARIPEFHDLWQDILQQPQSLSPLFAGIEQLLRTPTPPMFLANRITYEMESRLRFILENLPATSYSRNLMWFVQRYLSTPESESLFSDLIRYIIGVFHPSNAVLASNVVPRYVFLGGLLRFIRSPVVAANAKLALFYDWLFYDPKSDTIMNIEPGVLIIAQSVDKYTFMTASFIEFLAYESDAYSPELAPAIRGSIGLAMHNAVEKGVIPSIMPIYKHPRIEVDIRQNLYYLFPQLVPPVPEPAPSEASADDAEPAKDDDAIAAETRISRMFQEEFGITDFDLAPEGPADSINTNGISDTTEEDGAPEDVVLVASAEPLPEISVEHALEDTSLWLFGSTLQTFVDSIAAAEPDVKQIGGSVKEIVDMFAQSEASILAITRVLASIFSDSLDMEDVETNAELTAAGESSDGLEHDLLHYILIAAADYTHTTDMTNSTRRVLQLLVQLTEAKVDVGFRWLLHSVVNAGKPVQYARYVDQYAEGTLQAALVRDLGVLQEQFPGLFYTVLPQIYAAFPDAFPGCRGIVKSAIALIDQPQVYRLSALIARGQLQLFGHRQAAIVAIIGMTLESDAFEQVCFWQLLNAEVGGDEARVAGSKSKQR